MNEIFLVEDQLVVLDPGPEMIPFMSTMSPGFRVESVQPGPWFTPKFRGLDKEEVVLEQPLFELDLEDLREAFFKKRSASC